MTTRVAIFAATKKGLHSLKAALRLLEADQLAVATFQEENVAHSYHEEIIQLASDAGVCIIPIDRVRRDLLGCVLEFGVRRILCVGWRFLIQPNVIDYLQGDVIVAHDSLLPKLRGFAPLPTAMIIGERETGVTFIRCGTDIDNGSILFQARVIIDDSDTIATLIDKTLPLYEEGVRRLICGPLPEGQPQDDALATYSIWRDSLDYRIDWTRDSGHIWRTIRALGFPYLGAQCVMGSDTIIVHNAEMVPDLPFVIRQPGKVWKIDSDGCPLVVCGKGMLKITSATCCGQSIIPMKKVRVRFQ